MSGNGLVDTKMNKNINDFVCARTELDKHEHGHEGRRHVMVRSKLNRVCHASSVDSQCCTYNALHSIAQLILGKDSFGLL